MYKPQRVEFKTADGTTLRGDFFQAEGDKRPIIVMTAGFSLTKEHGTGGIARSFREAGYSALVFDYRSYGSSDGLPRQSIDLIQQAEDYWDAVSFAQTLSGIDPNKVVVWGIGHGGADTIIAAADDPRPAAVILQSPIISGRRDAAMWPELVERALADRAQKTLKGDQEPTYIQVWPNSIEEAQNPNLPLIFRGEAPFAIISEWIEKSKAAGTPWENKVTLQSVLYTARTEPIDFINRIKQPTLYVVYPEDPFTGTAEFHRTAFDRMGSNAEFAIIDPPIFDNFENFLASAVPRQVDFLKKVVG